MIYYLSKPHLKRKKTQCHLLLSLPTDMGDNQLGNSENRVDCSANNCRHFARAPDRCFTRSLVAMIDLFSFTWRQRAKKWFVVFTPPPVSSRGIKPPCTQLQRFQSMVCLDRSDSSCQLCAAPNACSVENSPSGILLPCHLLK